VYTCVSDATCWCQCELFNDKTVNDICELLKLCSTSSHVSVCYACDSVCVFLHNCESVGECAGVYVGECAGV
jgi:hypothetical protein